VARTRNIKPGFFTNDVLGECDPLARLLFAGLWCHADRNGVVEYRPRRLKAEILPFDEADVPSLVSALENRGFVVRFDAKGTSWLQVTKFHEHQSPHPREPGIDFPQETQSQEKPGLSLASAETSPGKCQDEPCRAPKQAGFPTPSPLAFSTSLLPSPLPFSVASQAIACSSQEIRWAALEGWQGITEGDRDEWQRAYPAIDLDAELAAAGVWLKANPQKAKRSKWQKFLAGWFKNAQDRGGTRKRSAKSSPPTPGSGWSEDELKRLVQTKQRLEKTSS
jgi:hypothetical protein